ncbi:MULTISPECIES: double-strand break repair protein AddB [Rhizobium]|uniref:Double-strand break repair helicase AddB type protein n=1 Tax=Rhizobium phaseoli TaxID=396 RepID=A0A192T5A1_9HYPH|nr:MULTISPECIES: double-strand break repair protein AddB [Rhizobium]ANL38492.1 double-strand break repair helicase AddB type protein [Rhizobium phaseoli]ANL51241.1 double-strand break repair helicase AddB type protein [Rhizobium phaseoli]ANL57481.1 double-strand break repair helicase AddB type protein [Rhizobium phaseoli]ANL82874.1 double-strand break repair helicase AddB type protein [Rhizobium phaseoli]ANL89382.1 double-strand break repair helicase AddB type protein [Rhizobium phaseoli]
MTERHQPRVLTIPAGLPFLKTLATTLCDGRLTPLFRHDVDDPLSLAGVTIYLPTRRAVRVLRSEFVDLLGGRSAILPVIRPLGETDDDSGYFDEALPATIDLAQPLSNTARLLELARLILAWRNKLPEIVRHIHSDSPLVAPASPADAIWLARNLAELIDSIETEDLDWSELSKLDTGDYAAWWQLTAEFLQIASAFWPARLTELGKSSPARHRNAILRAEAARLSATKPGGPIIIAGSTGSVPATADLISAVANLREGVIVLPGLDLAMPEGHWQMVAPEPVPGQHTNPASRSHPQYGLSSLLNRLRLTRADVSTLDRPEADLDRRAEILSRALAPAEATSDWGIWKSELPGRALTSAFNDVSLIEAANEREEATAIAVALRLALERPGQDGESRAALITPDRNLARRVMAELSRFGILADDSAGTPLSATPQGSLLQLLLEASLRPGDPVAIVSLLKHPLARFGLERNALTFATEALELLALRGGVAEVDIGALEPLLTHQLAEQALDRHAPQWRKALPAEAADAAFELAGRVSRATEPLAAALVRHRPEDRGKTASFTLSEWAQRTGRALEAVAADPQGNLADLWSNEAGDALASLLGEVIDTDGQMEADGPQWIDITAALAAGHAVKPRALSHPRLFIFGTLEARLQSVDTLILGGLNEGSWPGQSANNPFIPRMMKTEIGLEPPERRIGQLAHDFEMANGTRHLIYSRALRQGSTPTVASRWLQRLLALGGEAFEAELKGRGTRFLQWAGLIDRGETQAPAQRPSPKPPLALQPQSYSFSEVGRLRRDPYAIYARRILRLDPVDAFNRDPGAAERGTLYHKIIDRFIRAAHVAGTPEATAAMELILTELFDMEKLPPHIDAVWRPRFREVARAFLEWEAGRRPAIRRTLTEVRGGVELEAINIRLNGVADRIDITGPNAADIIDYKTGYNPSPTQARALLDPQLALEAAALRAGAFRDAGSLTPQDLLYVRLRPGNRFQVDMVNNENAARSDKAKSAIELAEESVDQLVKFVTLLQSGEKGFTSRLIPAQQFDFGGDYDHLARVSEWSTAENEEGGGDE